LAIHTSVPNLPGGQGWSAGSKKKLDCQIIVMPFKEQVQKYKEKGGGRQGKTDEYLGC
jgi:hypothetical protein